MCVLLCQMNHFQVWVRFWVSMCPCPCKYIYHILCICVPSHLCMDMCMYSDIVLCHSYTHCKSNMLRQSICILRFNYTPSKIRTCLQVSSAAGKLCHVSFWSKLLPLPTCYQTKSNFAFCRFCVYFSFTFCVYYNNNIIWNMNPWNLASWIRNQNESSRLKLLLRMIFRLVNIRHDVSHWVLVLVFIVGSYFRR